MILAVLFASLINEPGPLAGHAMVYSEASHSVLMFGGDASGKAPLYSWQDAKWVPVAGSELPIRSLAATASDTEGNVFVHGGSIATPKGGGNFDYKLSTETWMWDGKTWKLVATSGPPPRDHHTMVYDSARKRFVLYGGSDADPTGRSVFYGDTWEWVDSKWKLITQTGPPARCHHAMAYDPIRKLTVLVGGYGPNGADLRTWLWDGETWKSTETPKTPAVRGSPRMAWDEKRAEIILFGGDVNNLSTSDTWGWNGKAWHVFLTGGPPGRSVHAMAYDRKRNKTVLYGGSVGNEVKGDTWELDEAGWKQISR